MNNFEVMEIAREEQEDANIDLNIEVLDRRVDEEPSVILCCCCCQ